MMAGLAVLGLALFFIAHTLTVKAEKQQLGLDRLRNQTIAAQQSKLHVEQRMHDPVNAAVLDRAHFLNALFLRKSFSWTAVMMDLENVLPSGVQVTSIEPGVTANGDVIIRLRVAGERDRAVQLVRNLERSRRFLQPRLSGESAQAKENGTGGLRPPMGVPNAPAAPAGVEFEILADYNPLPAGEKYPVVRVPREPVNSVLAPTVAQPVRTQEGAIRDEQNRRNGFPPYGVRLTPHHEPPYTGGTPSNGQGGPQ